MTKPILMVKPQHVKLQPEPIRPEWIISGNPTARSNKLATSRDNTSNVIVWDCTPGQFQWRYSQDETVVIVAGEAFITDQDGIERRLGPGELAFFRPAPYALGALLRLSEKPPYFAKPCGVRWDSC
jgi:uncharacterized cupin superfamily protein